MMYPEFFQVYENGSNKQLIRATRFIDAFRAARDTWHLGKPHHYTFVASYIDSKKIFIPQQLYAQPVMCSRTEAVTFIQHRITRVEEFESQTLRTSYCLRSLQNDRCHYDDTIEQQIRDYIATCPWRWRTEREVEKLDFFRFKAKEPCPHCDKPLEAHPFAEITVDDRNPRLRSACNGLVFVL